MIQIVKGEKSLKIPAGAYKRYAKAGWKLASTSNKEETSSDVTNLASEENSSALAENTEAQEELGVEEDEEVIYVDPEELANRPLSELDKEELRILAEYKGLELDETASAKQLRAALRALE